MLKLTRHNQNSGELLACFRGLLVIMFPLPIAPILIFLLLTEPLIFGYT